MGMLSAFGFSSVPGTDVAGARRLLADGAVLLDVREPGEWDAGHAPEAVHIPMGQLAARLSEVGSPGSAVVAVCRSGSRSARVTQWLRGHGYEAVNLDGGMRAWAREGHPVVRDDGGTGRVV